MLALRGSASPIKPSDYSDDPVLDIIGQMTAREKSQLAKAIARDVGFDEAGVTHAGRVAQSEYYRQWVEKGHLGSMEYLRRNAEVREEPARLLPGARAIICVMLNYRRAPGEKRAAETKSADEQKPGDAGAPTGRVAQYARGVDYHVVMRRMMDELVKRLRGQLDEAFESRVFVDTGPLLERQLAAAAGLGWIGKNTCLLNNRIGSFTFLGEIITTLDLAADNPMPDHCGSCTRCLDACPTQAFVGPYRMDASRCISYLTIEHRGEIPPEFHEGIRDWVYGCDICQEVCPFNSDGPLGTNAEIGAERIGGRVDLSRLVNMRSGEYKRLTRGTAAMRASRTMWRRNAEIASTNAGTIGPGPNAVEAAREAST